MEQLLESESRRYAKIRGQRPGTVLGRHADGRHIALQALDVPLDRAGAWNVQSGKLVWEPKNTVALAWMPNGDQVLAVTHRYEGSAKHPRDFLKVRQSEIGYELKRLTWPGIQPITSCSLSLDSGWFSSVAVSPAGDRAAIRWIEQDVAGFVIAEVGRLTDVQLAGVGYRTTPNNISEPVFSPNGGHVVIACGRSAWWNQGDDPTQPSPGGTFEAGHIAVYEMDGGPACEEPIEVDVPEGWLPADIEDPRFELLGDPRFTATTTFTVLLPNGEERAFEVGDVGR